MQLYHVSFTEYEVGKTYIADNPNGYHLRSISRGDGWINEEMDNMRPDGYPSRIASFYACDALENCQAFIANKKIAGNNPTYYKVEMDRTVGFPMVLVDRIKKMGQGSANLSSCINEYWSPTQAWKYLEFLSPQMTILEKLDNPNSLMAIKGSMNYNTDFETAKRLFL